MSSAALDIFSEPTRAWFSSNFSGGPTDAQRRAWPAIDRGDHVLVSAPTGSGKTLTAFLAAIDRVATSSAGCGTRVVYVSPLRALAVDVDKNLRAPIAGIDLAAQRLGVVVRRPTVGVRTGDTSAADRRRLVTHPPDILITTPESLYLMATSSARDTLTNVDTIIVDEIHALASTKRGAHLAVTLERIAERCTAEPQRIGLSATQRPLSVVGGFLGGNVVPDDAALSVDATLAVMARPVTLVDVGSTRNLDLEVRVPVDDMSDLGQVVATEPGRVSVGPAIRSIWPAVHVELVELILGHRSTIVFVNSRRLAERLAAQLNELAGRDDLVRAHHGSLSRERRLVIEDELKAGSLRGLVATSSLELGIDMGAVDLVIQVESPRSVARGLQRVGRAGHQVGASSRGRIFPKHRGDLLEAAVVVERMRSGEIESTELVTNPLDVLAQQIVAAVALEPRGVDDLWQLFRRTASFATLSRHQFENTLDMLAGRYPSTEFSGLTPRVVWDRVDDVVSPRTGAQRVAVTSGGTIPDRGLFGVHLPDGMRVGELDEEMVYETRPGETVRLGASSWRIEEITHDRVVVTPAPGAPGRMPFWRGDGPGRPVELGRALGRFVRELRAAPVEEQQRRLMSDCCLDARAAANLRAYLDEQAAATGAVPDDRTIVVERFRDEIGDWRLCILSPFGARVHGPWAMAINARLEEHLGGDAEVLWSDDGIVVRLGDGVDELPADVIAIDPGEIDALLVASVPSSAMFASRFRECAGRSLLLPRRRPGQRTPLWQQRQRSADLLAIASRYPTFPILLETTRELLVDHFDVDGLKDILGGVASRHIRLVEVETPRASPMAVSLLFAWIAVYMYEGDAPLAERRAAALALDRDLLRDLLGTDELRDLLDEDAVWAVRSELQHLEASRRARSIDGVHDLLRRLGPLSRDELSDRVVGVDVDEAVAMLVADRRAIVVELGGDSRLADIADAGRLRDGVGVALPVGIPAAFTETVEQPLAELLRRQLATEAPLAATEVAERWSLPVDAVVAVLERLAGDGLVLRGGFRPGGHGQEYVDREVLRRIRRRSLAALRAEIEPVDQTTFVRFLADWHGIGRGRRGSAALVDAVDQLQGASLIASTLDPDVFPVRVGDYQPALLDDLCAAGDLVWVGSAALGARDGRVRLAFRDRAADLLDPPPSDLAELGVDTHLHRAILGHLSDVGASVWLELRHAAGAGGVADGVSDDDVVEALWDLVWSGLVTNDSLVPLRARLRGSRAGHARGGPGGRRPAVGRLTRRGPLAASGRWWLVERLHRSSAEPNPTGRAIVRTQQLLERYGVLTREMALAEGVEAGFAGMYPVLTTLEEQGRVRRGYFVAGLGAAQFARDGAVDRLRAVDAAGAVVLAASDPAQPFGAALAWPSGDWALRPSRRAGLRVVIAGGELLAVWSSSALALPDPARLPEVVDAIVDAVADGRLDRVEIGRIDGEPPAAEAAAVLVERGFAPGYRGFVLRRSALVPRTV